MSREEFGVPFCIFLAALASGFFGYWFGYYCGFEDATKKATIKQVKVP